MSVKQKHFRDIIISLVRFIADWLDWLLIQFKVCVCVYIFDVNSSVVENFPIGKIIEWLLQTMLNETCFIFRSRNNCLLLFCIAICCLTMYYYRYVRIIHAYNTNSLRIPWRLLSIELACVCVCFVRFDMFYIIWLCKKFHFGIKTPPILPQYMAEKNSEYTKWKWTEYGLHVLYTQMYRIWKVRLAQSPKWIVF